MIKKEWKPLFYRGMDLTDRFLISNYGELYSLKSNKILKQNITKTGYFSVTISIGSRKDKISLKIHKAVAENFLDKIGDSLVVNHKDGNKLNNYVENLEWVTQSENVLHAIRTGLYKAEKPIKCLTTGQIFSSIKDACLWCGLDEKGASIYDYFKNDSRKTAGKHPQTGEGLTWKFVCFRSVAK